MIRALEERQFDPLVIPGLESVLESHRTRDPALWARVDTRKDVTRRLKELRDFIRETVFEALKDKELDLSVYDPFMSLFKSDSLQVDVFTLNHDLIIDDLFKLSDISFHDGFTRKGQARSVWDKKSYRKDFDGVNVFKLHGAINWYSGEKYEPYPPVWILDKSEIDEFKFDGENEPEFLIGTYNKYFEYTQGIYLDMISLFDEFLARSDRLITVGYGFGDIGVNNVIAKWWWDKRDSENPRTIQIFGDRAGEHAKQFYAEYNKYVDFANRADLYTMGFPDILVCNCKLEKSLWDSDKLEFSCHV
ncbi:MAG: SIR2 family protein [candidate division Zixibacteria bacterium]|nr:SIR2 family protein [candidate division Zixibacteria bacterium]